MTSSDNKLYSGTSGLALPGRQSQYPPEFQGKSRLSYYASLFNSVEINSSFYKLPQLSTVCKWADTVPDNFQFTFKLSKVITHSKELEFNPEDIRLFFLIVANVREKKGCLLVQFPPRLKIEKFDRLRNLLMTMHHENKDHNWRIALEFRNSSWYDEAVYNLLKEFNASLVLHDLPASAPPLTASTADFIYLRFHGPEGRYRGSYANDFLYNYAQQIKAWISEGKTVYLYFNNTMGDAVKNLETLNSLLQLYSK